MGRHPSVHVLLALSLQFAAHAKVLSWEIILKALWTSPHLPRGRRWWRWRCRRLLVVVSTIPALRTFDKIVGVAFGALPLGAPTGWVALGHSCSLDPGRRTPSTHAPVRIVARAA